MTGHLSAWLTPIERFSRANGLAVTGNNGHPLPRHNVNVLELLRITPPASLTLTATNSNQRSHTLTLVVNPGPANGIQSVVCGSSNRISAGQNFLCEMRFAASVPAGQQITYEVPSPQCFLDSSGQRFTSTPGIGVFTTSAAGQVQRIPLTHVPGQNCGGQLGSTTNQLRLNFWLGPIIGQPEGPNFATLVLTVQ